MDILLRVTLSIFLTAIVPSCSQQQETVWVAGYTLRCDAGAGIADCLLLAKVNGDEEREWQYFYSPIEGFEFKKGIAQKIKVRKQQLDPEQIPQDSSSIRYTLIKTLEERPDDRSLLEGTWSITSIEGSPPRGPITPNMNISLRDTTISGIDGCNNYRGTIDNLDFNKIQFSALAATRKMCADMSTSDAFHKTISNVNGFKIETQNLLLTDEHGTALFELRKTD